MADIINFFAYGELMVEEYFREQGLDYVAKLAATLSAHRVVFNKVPSDENAPEGLGLTNIEPTPDNAGMAVGVMYEMDDKYLPRLDEIHQAPQEYQRKILRFNKHDFAMMNGFLYMARPEKIQFNLKPDKATMKTLRKAKTELPMLYFSRLMGNKTID
jgi:Gamma-glutamyl cyclotransferase, AIG2-like